MPTLKHYVIHNFQIHTIFCINNSLSWKRMLRIREFKLFKPSQLINSKAMMKILVWLHIHVFSTKTGCFSTAKCQVFNIWLIPNYKYYSIISILVPPCVLSQVNGTAFQPNHSSQKSENYIDFLKYNLYRIPMDSICLIFLWNLVVLLKRQPLILLQVKPLPFFGQKQPKD